MGDPVGSAGVNTPVVGHANPSYGSAAVPAWVTDAATKIVDLARLDPAAAARLLQSLQSPSMTMQAEMAAEIAGQLSAADMKKLAGTPAGRELLKSLESGMLDGNVEASHQSLVDRIRDTLLATATSPKERASILLSQSMQPGAYGQLLDTERLKKAIGNELKRDFATGLQVAHWMMQNALPADARVVAAGAVDHMTDAQLKDLALSAGGTKFLEDLKKALNLPYYKSPQEVRIDKASKAAEVVNAAQTEVSRTPGFDKLTQAARTALLDAAAKHAGDPDFIKGLKNLAGDQAFAALADKGVNVVNKLDRFAGTSSYANLERGKNVAQDVYVEALRIIGTISIQVESGPASNAAKNTLDRLVDGRTGMKVVDDANATAAAARLNTIDFNVAKLPGIDPANLIALAIHEVNHTLHGDSKPGTAERFLDEYRAYYLQYKELGGGKPDPAAMQDVFNSLIASGGNYDHLGDLYVNDAKFAAVADQIDRGLQAKPPKVMTPEDLRAKLLALPGNEKSVYLNTASRMENK